MNKFISSNFANSISLKLVHFLFIFLFSDPCDTTVLYGSVHKQTLFLHCNVISGNPRPSHYMWKLNGTRIAIDDPNYKLYNNGTLAVHKLSHLKGFYECFGRNMFGFEGKCLRGFDTNRLKGKCNFRCPCRLNICKVLKKFKN